MLDFSIYLLYRAASVVVGALPMRLLFRLGQLLGLAAWMFHPGYRRLARQNLAIAFGNEKTARERSRIARHHFQQLGANLLCSIKLGTMPAEKIARHVDVEHPESIHDELRAGRGIVLVLGHLSSWELVAQLFPSYFKNARNGVVYQKLRNRFIDADVRNTRGRMGVEMFDRNEGFQKAIELLRSGGVLGILSDQHAGDHGMWTPFFGRLASTTPLPGLLAKRTGAAVVGVSVYTAAAGHWRMVFTPHINTGGDSVQTITAKANALIAAQIRSAPEDWFWVHNRWKTPHPNFLLMKYKRGVYLPPNLPPGELKPFRILIRGTNWLGDSVVSAAAVRAIKQGRPDAHITVAALSKVAPVWKLVPEVDEVIALPKRSLLSVVRLLRRQPRFDVAVLFPNSLRSALEVWLAGVPRRVGYRGHRRSWLLNQIVPERVRRGPIEHQVEDYLHIARFLGASPARKAAAVCSPRKENDAVRTKIALCPGAEYGPAKRWLPERFAEVASIVAAAAKVQWVLFGTAADTEIGAVIAAELGASCVNRIGKTTLEQLIEELGECRLLLTNDTGTMHLATLLDIPVVAVFGSTEPRLTGPLSSDATVIRHHVECSPCFLRECPIDFRCMHAVGSAEVAAAVLEKLPQRAAEPNSVASLARDE